MVHNNIVKTLEFIPRHMIVAEYYGFTLAVRVSVHLSLSCISVCPPVHISFPDDNELTSVDFHQTWYVH